MAGPRIVDYQQQTSPNPTGMGANMRPADMVDEFSNAMMERTAHNFQSAADSFNQADEENARAWAANAVSKSRLEWTTHFVERQNAVEPGAPEFTPKLLSDFDEYSSKIADSAPTEKARMFVGQRLNDLRTSLGESAVNFEAKARIDFRMDQYGQGIQNTAKLMNTDPSQYKVALAEQLAVIDASGVPPTQKSALRQKAIDDVSTAAVWTQIQRSPDGFLNSIGFAAQEPGAKTRKSADELMGVTGNTAFDALPFEKRVQMFEGAIRQKSQLDVDAERAATKKMKELSDNSMKEAWGRLASGKLTRAYVEEIRPVLDPNEYHSLLVGMKAEGSGAGQKTDPATFRHLQELLYTDPEEAEKYAFKAHKNGLLSNEHLSSGLSRARDLDRSEGPKSEYERSRKLLIGSLDPGPMVPDPVGRSRLAEATDEFDRWVSSGKRTDKEINDRSRELIGQYKFIDMSNSVIALPSPRSGQIRRSPNDRDGMQADLLQAAKKAEEKRKSGEYSEADYANEMGILNRWRKTIQGK